MGLRRMGSAQRLRSRTKARQKNTVRKRRERASRDRRMVEQVAAGSLPYTPWVMSWLCAKLDKPPRKVTPEDVQTVVAETRQTLAR